MPTTYICLHLVPTSKKKFFSSYYHLKYLLKLLIFCGGNIYVFLIK